MTQKTESSLIPADGPSDEDPVRALRERARREQILAAAGRVFGERGYHRAKVRDVAEAAGVAEGTIYNYFDGKGALLLGLLDALNETGARPAAFERARAEGLDGFLEGYLRHRLAVLEPSLEVLRPVLSEVLVDAELRARYRDATVAPTTAAGEAFLAESGVTDPALATRAVAAQVLGLVLLRLLGDEVLEARWDELPGFLAGALLDGLAPRGARRAREAP